MASHFPALSHPGFRNFWIAQCISVVGTWMQNISLPWLAYAMTDSPLLLGLLGTFQYLPSLLLSLHAGVLVDRLDKRTLTILATGTSCLGSLAVTVMLVTGTLTYPVLLGIALVMGVAQCLEFPSRQSYMLELVGRDDLTNAVALNSSAFNAARIAGPAVAGLLMATVGIASCFLANTLSFLPVLGVLALQGRKHVPAVTAILQTPEPGTDTAVPLPGFLHSIQEGVGFALSHRILLRILASTAVMGIFALNYSVLMPVKVKEWFGGKEATYGLLMSFMGIGSLLAAVLLAFRKAGEPMHRHMSLFAVLMAAVLLAQAFTRDFLASGLLMTLSGFFSVAYFTTATSSVQYFSPPAYRGRMLALYSLCFGGMSPLGSIISGSISQAGGSQAGFAVSAVAVTVCIGLIVLASRRRDLREAVPEPD